MLKPGKQKIAICFSGQLRTWKSCVETWHNILMQNGDSSHIDVFCHLWDYNTKPNCVEKGTASEKVSSEEISELLDILKPKKFLIEPERQFTPFKETQPLTYSPFLSQFYGIMRAARLKKEYEIENDIMYDVVARARYDAFFINRISDSYNLVEENTMHGFHFGWDPNTNRGRMGDIFWFSDSQTYDIIADYYLNNHTLESKHMRTQDNSYTPEFIFFHYIKKNSISIQVNHWDIKLFRKSEEESFTKEKGGYETW